MTDQSDLSELLVECQKREAMSVGYDADTLQSEQIAAFERYLGANYGDEQPGRSQVHTREVFETIEWLRPDIARMFGAGGKAVEIEPWAQGSEKEAEAATDFLNHVFFEQQDGHAIVDGFFFDGGLQKLGVVGVFWEEPKLGDPETYEGVNLMQAQQLAEPTQADVLETTEREDGLLDMTIQKVKMHGRPYVKPIAPEDFRIESGAVSIDDARYCGHVERTTKSELKLQYPNKTDVIEEHGHSSRSAVEMDERRAARFFDDEGESGVIANSEDDDEVLLFREFIYYDLDQDGYEELIHVCRLETAILYAEPVEENPYACWSPIRIPHKLIGLSIADVVKDIQKTQTVLLRSALDSVYQSVAPRMLVNEKSVNLADLLTVRPGGVIRVKEGSDVRQAAMPMVVPDLSTGALAMMEHVNQMAEARSGVTRHAQGMDPDALNKTATGIKLMQNAASVRKEMIARNFASGLEAMFRKFYRLLVRKADQRPQQLRVGRQWVTFTPSQWEAEARVRVHVGHGTGDREAQVGQLTMLLQMQREFVANFGMANPIVTPAHLHHTVEQIGKVMGFRNMDRFFADPQGVDPQAMQQLMAPKPSPEMEKVKAQAEADQAKLQLQAQADAAKAQREMQQLEMEMQLKREQIQAELQLKREQMVAEMALKREIEEVKVSRGYYDKPAGMNGSGGSATSPVRVGGDPG